MKHYLVLFLVLAGCRVQAQPVDPVSLVIAKAIRAIDLKIQRLQNETLLLQRAQKVAEHELGKLKLSEIREWQQRQEALYADYFSELRSVKPVISEGSLVKQLVGLQLEIVEAYRRSPHSACLQPAYDRLLQLGYDLGKSRKILLSAQTLALKDGDRVQQLSLLLDRMTDCLEAIQWLNKENSRLIEDYQRNESDRNWIKKLNMKP